jgi:hypothetical protein
MEVGLPAGVEGVEENWRAVEGGLDGGAFSLAPSSKGELDGGRRWMSDKARKFAVGPGDAGAELLPLSVFISLWWRHPSSQGRLEDVYAKHQPCG